MKPLRLLLLLLTACLSAGARAERLWTPDDLPVPYLQDARRHVSNPDGKLSAAAVDSADALLSALERDKGVQTLVAVVGSLAGDDPYAFAMALGKKYGVGSRKQRTGLILVVATEQRSYEFLTGNGLEGTLPDALLRRIQNRITVPALKRGDWDAAILGSLRAIDAEIRGDASLVPEDDDLSAGEAFSLALLFALLLAALAGAVAYFGQRRCPRCGRRGMNSRGKRRFRDSAGRRRVRTSWRCPHCGYEDTTEDDDNAYRSSGSGGPLIFGPGGGGGSFPRGGSFGGGSFGGGGSGGRF